MSHTKTPWRAGHPCDAIVADETAQYPGSDKAIPYYGGCLIAESLSVDNREFVLRAVNAHAALAEYFHASESLQMTIGHPEASSSDEDAAENRFRLAKVAARDALAAKAEAA